MGAVQREAGRRVIEVRTRPRHRVVALFARRGEGSVIDGRLCVVEVGLVTRYTRRYRDVVVVIDVAVDARSRR